MEKLTVTNGFNKSLESLRTTECSAKEKLHHFNHLSECLTHPHLQSNYQQFIRPTIGVLVLFCEDSVDSTVRMSAYENLIKVLRIAEATQQTRKVLIDLYHEIKKNGNERSLRICLSLFAYLISHVTQKRARVYVQNMLPALHAICARRETMLLESFSEFLHPFCNHLSLSMTESEVTKLLDVFLANLTVGCATKRRCMAQNTMTVLEHQQNHRKRHTMASYALTRSTEVLVKNRDEVNTTLGILGLWRLLIPLCLTEMEEVNGAVQEKLLEIFDLAIQYLLSCPNHSVINATLEVLIALTHNVSELPQWRRRLCSDPNDILSKRNSLKMVVCGKEAQILAEDTVIVSMDSDHQLTMEMIETTTESVSEEVDVTAENLSLRSLKSTDSSISGFLNSIIPSTTEFFHRQRLFPDSPVSRAGSSATNTPHKSQMAVLSPSQEAEVLNYTPASTRSGKSDWCAMEFRDCPVFGISDLSAQSILSYSMRVLCSKYLLTGKRREIIPDTEIRVSIKHLSLLVLANILSVAPELFLQPLNLSSETESLDIDCDREVEDDLLLQRDEDVAEEHLLEIKEDHFGPASAIGADYLTPLSRSVDGSPASSSGGCGRGGGGLFSLDPRMTHSDMAVSHGSQIKLRVKRIKQFRESEQFIYEVLLLRNHSDPMLRSDIVFVVQNFLQGIAVTHLSFDCFMCKWNLRRPVEFLELRFLYNVIVKALQDEHHSVVKHALTAVPTALDFLVKCASDTFRQSTMDQLLGETLNLAEGKPYWVTKSHLCEILPKLAFEFIAKACCDASVFRVKHETYEILLNFLHDDDQRIRVAASKGLLELVDEPVQMQDEAIIERYIYDKVFANLSTPLNKLLLNGKACANEKGLQKLLFDLSNQLLDIGNKNSISGIITALGVIVERFPPVENTKIYRPFNFLAVFESFLKENSLVIFDNINHTEALKLYCEFMAARAVDGLVENDDLQFLLEHSLQLMNIFGHIVNNQKPLITHLTQKADLFTSDRELQKMQQTGYFGNKAVYLRIYKLIKVTYETYKIDVNTEVEEKLRNLLRAVMSALNLVLELKPVTSISQSTKLVEEILTYLNMLFNWEPVAVIQSAKFLFKYFFERNFVSRRDDYDYFRVGCNGGRSVEHLVQKVTEFQVMKPGEFYQEEEGHIKLFEPIVIKSLRLYMKSEPRHQSEILEFICQLLTLNVNYAMLDSNLEFFKFVQEQLDVIEKGRVKDSEWLIQNLIRFLFLLNNKKLINNPKIIHITDNLLANPGIRECSLRALIQLSEELFFHRMGMDGEGEEEDTESSTEKEFIFSILMKFLNYRDVQRNVFLILSTQRRRRRGGSTGEEYQVATMEGVLAMLTSWQRGEGDEEAVVVEGESIGDLLRVTMTMVDGEENKELMVKFDWELIERIFKGLDFERADFEVTCRVFGGMARELVWSVEGVAEGKRGVSMGLLVEKWIELQSNFIKRVDEGGSEGLLQLYEDCKLPKDTFMRGGFMKCLREKATEILSLEELLKVKNKDVELFLKIVDEWVENGVIAGYFEVIGVLDKSTDVDKMITRELIRRICLSCSTGELDLTEVNKNVLVENADLVVAVMVDSKGGLLDLKSCGEVLLEILKGFYSTLGKPRTVTIKTDLISLKYLEKIYSTNLELTQRVVEMLVKFFVDNERALVKKRSREMVMEINKKFNDKAEEGSTNSILLTLVPEFEQFEWFSNSLCPKSTETPFDIEGLTADRVDENWLWAQLKANLSSGVDSKAQLEILLSLKSDTKVSNILSQIHISHSLYIDIIQTSFGHMIASFRRDCIAYNPHVNYLTVPFLLKHSLDQLIMNFNAPQDDQSVWDLKWVIRIFTQFLVECERLETVALRSIELKLWDKFIGDHLMKPTMIETFLKLLFEIVNHHLLDPLAAGDSLEDTLNFLQLVLGNIYIFRVWNKPENFDKYFETFVGVIKFIHRVVEKKMRYSAWVRDYKGIEGFFDVANSDSVLLELYTKVSLLINLREELSGQGIDGRRQDEALSVICGIIHHIVRFNQIYPMAVIPHKYLRTVCDNLKLSDRLRCPVPMMSIGDLRDSDTLKDFVANVKDIGFTSRQQFEEYLMTLLVLLNTEFEEEEYDSQEQYVIRKTCLASITELLVAIKEFPRIGLASHTYVHTTRNEAIPIYMIHLKKLSEVLSCLPGCNPLAAPNLERDTSVAWNCSSQTRGFMEGQFNLPTLWQMVVEEEGEKEKLNSSDPAAAATSSNSPGDRNNLCLRNCTYNLEWFEIDYNSSVKMVLEISMQIYEVHGERYLSFLLPCLVRLTDLFVTRDQHKWLRDIAYRLHEAVPHEDANCHQYIVSLMCKTNAVLVPSPSEVHQLTQTVLAGYLKSKSPAILVATLKGLLVLFESCVLHNSSIGGLNEEIQQLRRVIMGYADRCLLGGGELVGGGGEYEEHSQVLWATIFYTLEKTVKLIPDCPFLARTVNCLGRTLRDMTSLRVFCGVVNGVERLVLTNCVSTSDLESFERIALEVVKKGSEEMAVPALKLLMTCIYIGSVDQLEKTQKCNGVVQDDPETILRLMEKVDVLFAKIKVSAPETAHVYGQVLSLIVRDLIPAKDVLTKVIKEMLISQPHIEVVAQILHQVFRSSIDAAYLPLLQDWLVSSLNNFLTLAEPKAIWCLTVIFVSASLNVHLLKVFPCVLRMAKCNSGDGVDKRLVQLFVVAAKDFYDKLTPPQKQMIVDCFTHSKHTATVQALGRILK